MADWHFKHMDALSMIGKRLSDSEPLDVSHRKGFADVHVLAESLKHGHPAQADERMKRVFGSLCKACRQAQLHPCTKETPSFHSCDLVRTHSR